MGNNWTSMVASGAGALLVLTTGFTRLGHKAEPDPRLAHAEVLADPHWRTMRWEGPPALVVGELAGANNPPAAPMGEGRMRSELAQPRIVTTAVGKNVRSHLSQTLVDAFRTATGDLELELRPHTDRDAVELATVSRVDFALIGGSLSARDVQAGLQGTTIGIELFALAVPADSPVRSLTSQQVRQVLTGGARTWSDFGYDLGPIRLFAPQDQDLQERAARTLVRGDKIHDGAEMAANERGVIDAVRGITNAIGVVRVRDGAIDEHTRLLQIDWVQPTPEAHKYHSYPYGIPVQVVTVGRPNAVAQRFLQFAASDDGREVLSRSLIVR